jgi:hypothetical protein
VNDHDHGGERHEGVDLTCGSGGADVRAAGTGLVVAADGSGWNRGFGGHVVIAHRLPGDGLVYSVYAHLASGSVTVKPGRLVGAGEIVGRVGKTGRATSPHLHFEIRRPEEPGERWENAKAIDPIAFVAARLPLARDDSSWARPYLEWAECACLFRPGARGDSLPSRAEWWRALAAATRLPFSAFPDQRRHAARGPGAGGDPAGFAASGSFHTAGLGARWYAIWTPRAAWDGACRPARYRKCCAVHRARASWAPSLPPNSRASCLGRRRSARRGRVSACCSRTSPAMVLSNPRPRPTHLAAAESRLTRPRRLVKMPRQGHDGDEYAREVQAASRGQCEPGANPRAEHHP